MTAPNNRPGVSVGIVTRNHERYIGECIESVLSQSIAPLEIIIGDDASDDETVRMATEACRRANLPVRILPRVPRLGVTPNCNRVIAACRGSLVTMVSGDDLFMPEKLERQIQQFRDHPRLAVSYHDVEVFADDPGFVPYKFSAANPPREGGAREVIRHGSFMCAMSPMFRREFLPAHGYNTAIPYASDWLFQIEVAMRGTVQYIPEVLGRYRRHSGNLTATGLSRPDPFLTLALVEEAYPAYLAEVRESRARLFRHYAQRDFARGNIESTLAYLTEASRIDPRDDDTEWFARYQGLPWPRPWWKFWLPRRVRT